MSPKSNGADPFSGSIDESSLQSLYGIILSQDYRAERCFPFGRRLRKSLRTSQQEAFLATLRAARLKAGLTQQELADRLGKPQSFVAKYENGERRIDVVEFVALADAIGAKPLSLFRGFLRRARGR